MSGQTSASANPIAQFQQSPPGGFFDTLVSVYPDLKPVVAALSNNFITLGAKDGYLFVSGSGFFGSAIVPPGVAGAGWFFVQNSPTFYQGGTFQLRIFNNSLYLQLNDQWSQIWLFQSNQGVSIGLDGVYFGNWNVNSKLIKN